MRNKTIKFAAIALLSVFALTACDDDIIAKPTGYGDNSPIVNIDGFNGTVYNNNFTDIYDSIRSGSIPSDVLNLLLYQYSMSVFGNYNKVTAATVTDNSFGEITLKQAVKDITETKQTVEGKEVTTYTGGANAKAFVKAHKAYWNKDKDGNRVKDDLTTPAGDDDDPTNAEYARVVGKWNTIEKRIAQKMYSEISGGSYSEENVFDEVKYLRSLGASIENKVAKANDVKDAAFKGVLTPEVEDYDVFKKQSKKLDDTDDYILHREFYQTSAASDEDKAAGKDDATYIEDKIIPDIYRQLLVEQYVLDESYDTLGRTSARKISVLAIKKNSNYSRGAVDLMNTFVKNVIFDDNRTEEINLDTFKMVSSAWSGAFMSEAGYDTTPEYDLMKDALPDDYFVEDADKTDGDDSYFKGTAYGDMMEEIEKISNNPNLSENEGTYTGGNTYSVEVGKEIKTRELQLSDYTSTGWYVKSVGASSLPDSLKNQLFDINVANALNGEACVEYEKDGNEWTTNVDKEQQDQQNNPDGKIATKYINVVGKIKGQYFLRNTSRIAGNPVENDILFESDGTYYVVLVEDAIRSKNLDKRNQTDLEKLEERINEIVQIIGNNDTYKNLSKKHWIEEMNIKYHDTEVYDYFKSNFPELFDDQSKKQNQGGLINLLFCAIIFSL